jgi:hypothetical protein
MFDDITFGKYYQPMSSPKYLQYINYNLPSTPTKNRDENLGLPRLSPDHNLNLLVNSVLSSPVARNNSLLPSLSENGISAVGSAKETQGSSQMTVSTTLENPPRRYHHAPKGRRTVCVQGENETDQEFKKRRNRVNQQRSRSNRRALTERLREEIVALKEIIAEKDRLIAYLQFNQFN